MSFKDVFISNIKISFLNTYFNYLKKYFGVTETQPFLPLQSSFSMYPILFWWFIFIDELQVIRLETPFIITVILGSNRVSIYITKKYYITIQFEETCNFKSVNLKDNIKPKSTKGINTFKLNCKWCSINLFIDCIILTNCCSAGPGVRIIMIKKKKKLLLLSAVKFILGGNLSQKIMHGWQSFIYSYHTSLF